MQDYISWQEDKLWAFLFTAYFRFTALSGDKKRFSPLTQWAVLQPDTRCSLKRLKDAKLSEPQKCFI